MEILNINSYNVTEIIKEILSELKLKASELQYSNSNNLQNSHGISDIFPADGKYDYQKGIIELYNKLYQAISVSNALYNEFGLLAQKRNNAQINKFLPYSEVIGVIERITEILEQYSDKIVGKLPMTYIELIQKKPSFNFLIKQLKTKFSYLNIENSLTQAIICSLTSVFRNHDVLRNQMKYIFKLMRDLVSREIKSQEELEFFLIGRNFNCPNFYNYYIKNINTNLEQQESLHQQYETILVIEDKIISLSSMKAGKLIEGEGNITDKIKVYIKEKKILLRQRIKIKRAEVLDRKIVENSDKIPIALPVAQFGLIIRLFLEMNLLPKEHIGKTFTFFSKNFKTSHAVFISAESLQKKSTTVEFATATKVKGILISMVNWLNKNYNTSNYST